MLHSFKRSALILLLLLVLSLSFTGCDLLDKLHLTGGDEGLAAPTMAANPDQVTLEKDEKGLTEVDRQHIAYVREKWDKLQAAIKSLVDAQDAIRKGVGNGKLLAEMKEYVDARKAILSAAQQVEKVDPAAIPEHFKDLYDNLDMVANRVRGVLVLAEQQNGTNLDKLMPGFNESITGPSGAINQFLTAVDASGLDAAVAALPPVDWAAEDQHHQEMLDNNRGVFNVSDIGLKWGASRWEVMGVEGLVQDAMQKETLSYSTFVYQYSGTRSYHFNEYGQLDSYSYDMNGGDFNGGNSDDPVYDDVMELSAIVMYNFVSDNYALKQQPQMDANGFWTVAWNDLPAETVLLSGNSADAAQPIHLEVTARKVQ